MTTSSPRPVPADALPGDIKRLVLPHHGSRADLNHVNAWLFGGRDALFLSDTGLPGAETRALIDTALDGRRLAAILCTHAHIDHVGQAGPLARDHRPDLYITRMEWEFGQQRGRWTLEERTAGRRRIMQLSGLDADAPVQLLPHDYSVLADIPEDHKALEDGDMLFAGNRHWQVITGGGHSPDAACPYDADGGLIILGDEILPDFTPYIGISFEDPTSDPLSNHIAFLERMSSIPEDTIGLPGHGEPFRGVGARAGALLRTHQRRLDSILKASPLPVRCVDLLSKVFPRSTSTAMQNIMTDMTLALLNHLVTAGLMERWTDEKGAWRFRRL